MASEEIEITIKKTGEVEIRTIGIKGPRCLDVAEALARIIGEEQTRELTQEYYEVQQQTHGQINVKRTL